MAKLMRRLPAIDHLDARYDDRIPVAHQMRQQNRPYCQAWSITLFPTTNDPRTTPLSSRITFNSVANGTKCFWRTRTAARFERNSTPAPPV